MGNCARWRKRLADGLSSSQSTLVKNVNQHLFLPYKASTHSNGVESPDANGQTTNSESLGSAGPNINGTDHPGTNTEQVVTLDDGITVPLSVVFEFKRTNTPPHIASGRGIRGNNDKYIFL